MAQKLNEAVNDILGIETKPETNDMEQMEIQALSEMSPPAKVNDKPVSCPEYPITVLWPNSSKYVFITFKLTWSSGKG